MLLPAREWTSTDGRKMEADFISATATQVTLKRAGQTLTLPLTRLSEADRAWIAEQAAASPAGPAKPIEGPYASLLTGDWALSKEGDLPFAIYGGKDLDGGKLYPLVLALHGRGENNENGKQVGSWMKTFTKPELYAKNPCIIVAPLGYQPYGGEGTAWRTKPGTETLDLVKDLVKSLPIDKTRVYCIGFSMGGYGTCYLINAEPRLFAAGVAVAGCSSPETASTFKKVPLWLFHAADDATVDVSVSRNLAEALKRDKECKYTEWPTGGHGIIGKVFDDLTVHDWLFAQGGK